MKNKYSKYRLFTLFLLVLTPFLFGYTTVVVNNVTRFNMQFGIFMIVFSFLSFFMLLFSIFELFIHKELFGRLNNYKKIAVVSFSLFYILEIYGFTNLLFYNDNFKDFFIMTSMYTDNNLVNSIYDKAEVDSIIKKNTDLDDVEDIKIDVESNYNVYESKFEEDILKHDENEKYKIIKIEGTTIGADFHYEGYMAIIYDPSLVHVAKSSGAGTFEGAYGEILPDISRKNNAVIAINAGGFFDPNWDSNGGIPHGDVVINGKIDSSFERGLETGGIIGFDKNDKLVLKRMTTEEVKNSNLRDAVDFGPYLIVNGENLFKNVNYYSWACARTAIGQREDGIVLMLVIDGLQEHSKGAGYADVAKIMEDYGAINAANLDGGTSTAMTYNHKYINSPWNGYVKTYRWLPNAFVVTSK